MLEIGTVEGYLSTLQGAIASVRRESIIAIIDALMRAWEADKQIFIFGNGGSASTASHFACDLGKGTIMPERRRFRVISLSDAIPTLTAWSNDADYADVFLEQLRNLLNPADLAIGITGSGNSPNVLRALAYAKERGACTVALTGFDGGKVKDIVDECLVVPADYIQVVEDVHLAIQHTICMNLRSRLAALPNC